MSKGATASRSAGRSAAITLGDIAEQVGVSPITVSEVLRGVGRASHTTRERVLEMATELGYRANASARAMRYGRFDALALLMSLDHPQFFVPGAMWNGIIDGLSRHDLQLHVHRLSDADLDNDHGGPKLFREATTDGLLINPGVAPEVQSWIEKFSLPAVWLNVKQPSDSVYVRDFEAAHDATRRLLTLGHQRVAYADLIGSRAREVDARGGHYSAGDRWGGYAAAMTEAGLEPVRIGESYHKPEERLPAAQAALSGDDRPTAVLTYSAATALPLLLAATHLNLDLPGDLSLVSFGHSLLCETGLAISTLVLPNEAMGRRAIEILIHKNDKSRGAAMPSEGLDCQFDPGVTCGPPPAAA